MIRTTMACIVWGIFLVYFAFISYTDYLNLSFSKRGKTAITRHLMPDWAPRTNTRLFARLIIGRFIFRLLLLAAIMFWNFYAAFAALLAQAGYEIILIALEEKLTLGKFLDALKIIFIQIAPNSLLCITAVYLAEMIFRN